MGKKRAKRNKQKSARQQATPAASAAERSGSSELNPAVCAKVSGDIRDKVLNLSRQIHEKQSMCDVIVKTLTIASSSAFAMTNRRQQAKGAMDKESDRM